MLEANVAALQADLGAGHDMTVSEGGAGKARTVSQVGATITDMRDLTGRIIQASTTGLGP